MDLETTLRYPSPADRVADLLADPDFVEELCRTSPALSYEVSVEGTSAGAFTVKTSRLLPTDEFPDAIRRFLGASLRLDQVDTWELPAPDGSRRGRTRVDVPGAPVSVSAENTLRNVDAGSQGSGSQQLVLGTLKATIPLLGGRVEKAAAPFLLAALRDQENLAGSRLAT